MNPQYQPSLHSPPYSPPYSSPLKTLKTSNHQIIDITPPRSPHSSYSNLDSVNPIFLNRQNLRPPLPTTRYQNNHTLGDYYNQYCKKVHPILSFGCLFILCLGLLFGLIYLIIYFINSRDSD